MGELVLGEALEVLIDHRGKTPKKLGGDFTSAGVPVASAMLVKDGRLSLAEARFVSEEMYRRWMPVPTKRHDVVLTSEAPLGRVALVPDDNPLILGQRLFGLRGREAVLDSRFLFYALQTESVQSELHGRATGTTVTGIRQSELVRVRISAPNLQQQKAIAAVLGALDDKIAANERIAGTAARLALMYGQQLLLKADGEEVVLAEHAEIVKGVSYRSAELGSGTDGLVTLKCVGRDGMFQGDGLKQFSGVYKEAQVVARGDIVVAQTDLTQRAEVIGRPVRVSVLNHPGRLIASLDLVVVKPSPSLSREMLFALLSTQDFRDHALGYCNGTTVLHMGARALPEYRFHLPTREVVKTATDVMLPLFNRSDSANQEIQALTRLRDALLPGLMSGAIRVHDAEKAVEDAV